MSDLDLLLKETKMNLKRAVVTAAVCTSLVRVAQQRLALGTQGPCEKCIA
jgi:hypothetical protein